LIEVSFWGSLFLSCFLQEKKDAGATPSGSRDELHFELVHVYSK